VSEDGADKSFEPTDLRREQFWKQGKFPNAKDAGWICGTAAALATLVGTREETARACTVLMGRTLGDVSALERMSFVELVGNAASPVVRVALAALTAGAIASAIVGSAQARFRLNAEGLSVDFSRLDPASGFKRMFGFKTTVVELLLSTVRLAVVSVATWRFASSEVPSLVNLARRPTVAAAHHGAVSIGRVLLGCLAGFVIVALLDYGTSWLRLEKEMRMTRKERTDESKQQDGDPKAKGRMKARARALARQRAVQGVKGADVIVTNPTHIAVALRYGPKDPAPVVVAKGHDELALRLRAEARKLGIPIMENRALARALDAEVQLGRPVPQAHFVAVARVLAFVMRMRDRGALRGTRRA
jgi:flagellar biosynthesis protein FlhB